MHESMKEKVPGKNLAALYEDLNDDDLKTDDFLEIGESKPKENETLYNNNQNQRKSMILPGRQKRGNVNDTKAFDQKLVDRALSLLLDY